MRIIIWLLFIPLNNGIIINKFYYFFLKYIYNIKNENG